MVNNVKKKRIRHQYYTIFWACLVSLLGLGVYLLGRYRLPLPDHWLIGEQKTRKKLFFLGLGAQLNVNIILSIFFMFFNTEKMDPLKLRKWKHLISRILTIVFSVGIGLYNFREQLDYSRANWSKIFLLSLIIIVVNCCLLELLIQLMNQYGICNGFNLILFTEFIPYQWIGNYFVLNKKFHYIIYLSLITIFFIWITSLKWEVPVETNTLYSTESKFFSRKRFKLGFKLNFSFMPLFYLSQFISFLFNLILMRQQGTNWFSYNSLNANWSIANKTKLDIVGNINKEDDKGFARTLLNLNERRGLFNLETLKSFFAWNSWTAVGGALITLIFLRWLMMWAQMRKVTWKTQEISKSLRNRGIYIDQIPTGTFTRRLLKKIINKLVLFWFIIVLFFNVIFDNVFGSSLDLSFTGWFSGVNIGTELINQIYTKFKYIHNK